MNRAPWATPASEADWLHKKKAPGRRTTRGSIWRRGWDSNPRYLTVRLISSQVHSATLPPLQCVVIAILAGWVTVSGLDQASGAERVARPPM